MSDPTTDTEAAVDPDEAIRAEIRSKLRVKSGETAEVSKGFLVATNIQNTVALRLLSGCA